MTSMVPAPSKVDDKYNREYLADVFQARIFGAFLSAAEHRKINDSLTRKEVAAKAGKDETGVSKIFSKPQNWTLKTVSDLAYALDLEIEFALVDKKDRGCIFLDIGFRRRRTGQTNCLAIGETGNAVLPENMNTLRTRMRARVARSGQQIVVVSPNEFETQPDAQSSSLE